MLVSNSFEGILWLTEVVPGALSDSITHDYFVSRYLVQLKRHAGVFRVHCWPSYNIRLKTAYVLWTISIYTRDQSGTLHLHCL